MIKQAFYTSGHGVFIQQEIIYVFISLTKEDSRDLFNLILVLSFEGAKDFFSENNLDFSALYPNY